MQGDSGGGMTIGRVDNDLGCSTMECSYYCSAQEAWKEKVLALCFEDF